MKLSDAIDGYLLFKSSRASKTTVETDGVILAQFLTWLDTDPDVTEVDADTVRRYLDHHEKRGLSSHTRRRYHATISGLYTWLSSDDVALVGHNPARAVPPPKTRKTKIRYLSQDEIAQLLAVTDRAHGPRRARALVLFLLDSGARATETAKVTLSNVNFKSGKVKVIGKGDKERFVYLGKRALSALWLYVTDERPEPSRVDDGHLFFTDDGYPMDRNSIRLAIRRLSKWAGVKANPHLFRHTAAVEHLRHGMDVFTLQMMMGHESLETTKKYLSALKDEDVETQARRTSPADNWRL